MAELKEYTVEINGIKHTMQLDEKDAKARNAVEAKQAPAVIEAPEESSEASGSEADGDAEDRTAETEQDDTKVEAKSKPVQNKARSAETK